MSETIIGKIGFFGQLEDPRENTVRYAFAGITHEDGKVSGMGMGYEGGGIYDFFNVYKNRIIPGNYIYEDEDEEDQQECLDGDTVELILSDLLGRSLYMEIDSVFWKHIKYNGDCTYSPIGKWEEQGVLLIVNGQKPVSHGNTSWLDPVGVTSEESNKYNTIEDFCEAFGFSCDEEDDFRIKGHTPIKEQNE